MSQKSPWPAPAKGKLGEFLQGLKVLDLSRHLPGPLASLLMVDMGASVLKIEPPVGDEAREIGPIGPRGLSIYFEAINMGKVSLKLDLKSAAGKARLLALADEADILLESFRPGTMDRLGVGPEALRARNPGLIYCALTGFGMSGPRRDQAGHDNNYLSLTGMLAGTGLADRPVFFDPPVADVTGGMMATIAMLGALNKRMRTGEGSVIDLSLADSVMPLLAFPIAAVDAGRPPKREGELLNGGAARYRLYRTKDGKFVSLGAVERKFWAAFCNAAGHPEWEDPGFEDPLPQTALIAKLDVYFATVTQDEAIRRLEPADCCIAPVLDLSDALETPQIKARGLVRRGPDGARQALFPARIDGEPPAARAPWKEIAEG
ncbi:MAG TPA: CoA transferase [Alphaproteobacteria bacterium]|nr:CoA transferase [Alphaproteobacteria bacterium]